METLFYEKSVRIFKLKLNLFEILAAKISNYLNLSFNPNDEYTSRTFFCFSTVILISFYPMSWNFFNSFWDFKGIQMNFPDIDVLGISIPH